MIETGKVTDNLAPQGGQEKPKKSSKEPLIIVKDVTKDYGKGRGIFDENFCLYKGEILGFVGANGAGKTTTIRNIMGFIKPDKGSISICGLDSWADAEQTKKYISYIPGEIAFPDLKSGTDFLKSQAELLGITDMTYANHLIEKLQLDPTANLKRMSKGMKQKTAIVAALMADHDILLLDEPTTGLDPLMRLAFIDIIKEQKKKGKTILISSHLYEELEKLCDRVALIDKGRIVNITNMDEINKRPIADFKVEFITKKDYQNFKKLPYNFIRDQEQYSQVTVRIKRSEITDLFKDLTQFKVKFISEVKYTLENHFKGIIEKLKENKND